MLTKSYRQLGGSDSQTLMGFPREICDAHYESKKIVKQKGINLHTLPEARVREIQLKCLSIDAGK